MTRNRSYLSTVLPRCPERHKSRVASILRDNFRTGLAIAADYLRDAGEDESADRMLRASIRIPNIWDEIVGAAQTGMAKQLSYQSVVVRIKPTAMLVEVGMSRGSWHFLKSHINKEDYMRRRTADVFTSIEMLIELRQEHTQNEKRQRTDD